MTKRLHSKIQSNFDRRHSAKIIIWFNTPFNLYSAINIGRIFLDLVEKHFKRSNILGKLFNKNTLKISYSCMPNLQAKISAHNKSIMSGTSNIEKGCNCQTNRVCPLEGECVVSDCVYMATVMNKNEQQDDGHKYVGLCTGLFKLRLANHEQSFRCQLCLRKKLNI